MSYVPSFNFFDWVYIGFLLGALGGPWVSYGGFLGALSGSLGALGGCLEALGGSLGALGSSTGPKWIYGELRGVAAGLRGFVGA